MLMLLYITRSKLSPYHIKTHRLGIGKILVPAYHHLTLPDLNVMYYKLLRHAMSGLQDEAESKL